MAFLKPSDPPSLHVLRQSKAPINLKILNRSRSSGDLLRGLPNGLKSADSLSKGAHLRTTPARPLPFSASIVPTRLGIRLDTDSSSPEHARPPKRKVSEDRIEVKCFSEESACSLAVPQKRVRVEDSGTSRVNDSGVEAIEDAEEQEITRCICGQPEYPGPPAMERDNLSVEDHEGQILSPASSEALSEAPENFFIQCDKCNVWQHGGCVGIMDELEVPDNYFCEQCTKEVHKVFSGANGQKYSKYLPVLDVRRSTRNHRDAANVNYERLRRVIAESTLDPADIATPRSSWYPSRDDLTPKQDSRSSQQNTKNTDVPGKIMTKKTISEDLSKGDEVNIRNRLCALRNCSRALRLRDRHIKADAKGRMET